MNDARSSLRRLFGRRLRPISSIVLLAVFVLILLLNLGFPMLEDQLALSTDLSAGKIYTLSQDSLDVLAGLAVCAAAYPLIYRVPAGAASLIPAGGLGRKRFPEL